MSNTAQSAASTRIASLLDANSFVEIGGAVTARTTDFNMQEKETPADGVITGDVTLTLGVCPCCKTLDKKFTKPAILYSYLSTMVLS